MFKQLSEGLESKAIDLKTLFPSSKEKSAKVSPTEPIALKFLYGKENHKLEIHMELEWVPHQ